MTQKIIILDFGSQTTQLIGRRVRELDTFCEIMPYNSKTVHFPVSLVERANLGSNLACGIAGTTLNIGVKGSDSLLKEIDAEDISVSIDLKDLKEGTYAVDADIVLPDGLELVEPVVTEVTISSTESVKNPD